MVSAEAIRGLAPRRYSLISGRCAPSAGSAAASFSESRAQVLVDVGVDGEDGHARGGEVADEERGQRGLAAAALPDESDLHVR
jgi:hypothetical protein